MGVDIINGCFEGVGSVMLWINVRRLYKDKAVRGVSILPTAFFTSWGIWNAALYYPSLHQWWSLTGGLSLTFANLVWIGQMFYYGRKNASRFTR